MLSSSPPLHADAHFFRFDFPLPPTGFSAAVSRVCWINQVRCIPSSSVPTVSLPKQLLSTHFVPCSYELGPVSFLEAKLEWNYEVHQNLVFSHFNSGDKVPLFILDLIYYSRI